MNRTLRNFWLDVFLFVLLGMDIALVSLTPRTPAEVHPGLGWHLHALISILLTLGCLMHIVMHWQWFQAVLSGKAKGRMKLIMNGIVVIMMLVANLSGHEVLTSSALRGLHNVTGVIALLGMSVHAIRHTGWMAATARRLHRWPAPPRAGDIFRLRLAARMIAQASLPQPVPAGINYYVLRWQDYVTRHAAQNSRTSQPPDYYLAYGDKYCRRFRLEVRRQFSPPGQAWIDKTCILLQQMLEQKRANDPLAFARLEEDPVAFRSFAYSNHAAAYIQGGIADLPLHDLILIVCLIDRKDLLTPDGLYQMVQVLVYLAKTYSRRVFDRLLCSPGIVLRRIGSLVGVIVLIGLLVHAARHTRWMAVGKMSFGPLK